MGAPSHTLGGTAVKLFWAPVLASSGPVLISLGDVRTSKVELSPNAFLINRFGDPFQLQGPHILVAPSDVRTAANVVGLLKMNRKTFVIRDKDVTTFADLQNGPFVLIGPSSMIPELPCAPACGVQDAAQGSVSIRRRAQRRRLIHAPKENIRYDLTQPQ